MKSEKRLLICVGGTGGHIYPAQAFVEQFLAKHPNCKILFVGSGLSTNRYFDRNRFAYYEVKSGTVSLRKPLRTFLSIGKIILGFLQSCRLIQKYQPDLVVGFGSYHGFPPLLAAKVFRLPVILHEANSIPGRVIRLLSPYVKVTGTHFPDANKRIMGKSLLVKMPLRKGYQLGNVTRNNASDYFHLNPSITTLLVFGGSQGASTINRLIVEAFEKVKHSVASFQIIHLTGDIHLSDIIRAQYEKMGIRAHVSHFESRMDLAWAASDLAITRAGASSIAEQMEFEVPGILIPYPHAMDNHQEYNADFLVKRVGAALKLNENQLNADNLSKAIYALLVDNCSLLRSMRCAMNQYKKSAYQETLVGLAEKVMSNE